MFRKCGLQYFQRNVNSSQSADTCYPTLKKPPPCKSGGGVFPETKKMVFRYLPPEKRERARRLHYESKLRSWKQYLHKRKEEHPYYKIRQNLNLLRMNNRIGSQTNVLRWSAGETKEHILKKLEICMELKDWEHEFITEAIFTNGARCDVLDLTEGTVYEILCTETDETFNEKVKEYPKELKIVKIRCQKHITHLTRIP